MSTAPQRTGSNRASSLDDDFGRAMSLSLPELHRQARDPQRRVWEPAAWALARRSEQEPEAFLGLRELLISAMPELRVRGVIGLGAVAQLRPSEVEAFLQDRLAESATLADPILLDALLETAARLPGERSRAFLTNCCKAPEAGLRAAAVSAMGANDAWPLSSLAALAQDPSPEVRATLALELMARLDNEEIFEIVAGLAQDADPGVRAAVGAGARGDSAQMRYLRMTLENDAVTGVREALQAPPAAVEASHLEAEAPGLAMAQALEAELDDDPDSALALLRRWLGRTGTLDLLRALADLCRNPECARLTRALYVLLAASEDDGKTRMLRMLGILDGVAEQSPAGELRTLVACCLEVVEAESVAALQTWAQGLRIPQGSSLDPNAWDILNRLARLCRGLGSDPGLLPLSKAASNIEVLAGAVEICPRPESEILEPAMERAVEVMAGQLNDLMSGAD